MKMSTLALTLPFVVALGLAGALAQHGHGQGHGDAMDPEAHFDKVASHLELTDAQRDKLREPFHEAFAAMQELHRLHGVIAAELTDDQKHALAQMIHEAMSGGDGGHR